MERAAAAEAALLREKASLLRESMRRSEAVREGSAAAVDSIGRRMAAVDEAVRPAQARTWSAYSAHDNVARSLRAVEAVVRHLDAVREAESVILESASKGVTAYLDAVDNLKSAEDFFTSNRIGTAGVDALKRVDELLHKAAAELENEFSRVLSECSKPVELEQLLKCLPSRSSAKDSAESQPNPGAVLSLPTLIDPRYVPRLSKLAQKSVQLGCHKQFVKIYRCKLLQVSNCLTYLQCSVTIFHDLLAHDIFLHTSRDTRSSTLELTLKQLGVEYVTAEEVQTAQAESRDAKIAHWIRCLQIAVKLLFPSERALCDQIFEGKHAWKDHCFAAATSKSLLNLLSFGQAISKSKTAPDKVFLLLDMFDRTLELQSEVEAVFAGDECAENRKSASTLVKCLAQAAKKTLIDFKDSIVKESPKNTSTDGDVHPLTSYVGNYIKYLMDYQSSLKLIFQESSNGDGTKSGLVSEISGLIHAVETNLDVKAKQYKDHALGILFLMNNINYIVRSIRGSEAKDLVGDDWIQRRRRTVQQHATQYKRVAWGKVLECLSAQGLTSSVGSATEGIAGSVGSIGSHSGTTSTSVIKARFKSFNKQFEEVCQTQMNWAIPDKELRDNLILAVAEILLPAYRSFLKRFGPLVENSHHASKYMKYTPEALEQTLGNLFAKKLPQ
ncbi:exocyst complex component EXO70A1-like isoform X1 [Triticum dicoccoides]|uniref:exocyst complex component EXO70A1-like isoform X1 n=1 Tax=Triticum dicoccoides TaxID=85692 RepID=UPI00188F1031|nr:exocyst complex component EXO70A1-like isoform X1 [Triticum dicoccoides]XP_037488114.1 exocyst complex component EXO70A1-like isoform X1 [Triticum dicoccoides]